MKFKFGDAVEVIKGQFHKGARGVVVGFIRKENGDYSKGRRYIVHIQHDTKIHAYHTWLKKVKHTASKGIK